MAVALRPAVLLIVVASVLFFAAGWLDTAAGATDPSTIASWVFGAVNLLVAVFIARGNERILALRIGLAAFFMVERPVTAIAFGPKPIESIVFHMATALLEAVILFSTLRIWRLGHSVGQAELAFLSLPSSPLAATAGLPANLPDTPLAGPIPSVAAPRARPKKEKRLGPLGPRRTRRVLLLTLMLALLTLAAVGGILGVQGQL